VEGVVAAIDRPNTGASDDAAVIGLLIELLGDAQEAVAARARTGLRELGSAAVDALIHALDPSRVDARSIRRQIHAIALLGDARARSSVQQLETMRASANVEVRLALAPALADIGGAVAGRVLQGLADDDAASVRLAAVEAFVKSGLFESLGNALLDRDRGVRDAAQTAIEKLEPVPRDAVAAVVRGRAFGRGSTWRRWRTRRWLHALGAGRR
jgi:hypothetical protein